MDKLSNLTKAGSKIINNYVETLNNTNRQLSATFENNSYDLHLFNVGPPTTATLTREEGLMYYRTMNRIRKMEKEVNNLYFQKKVRGFCHLYSGQEAVAVGINTFMDPKDTCVTSYRCHAWVLLMGLPMSTIFSELVAAKSGACRGKGGSMHMFGPNFYGGHGIVGAQVPIGTGLAFAHKYKNDGGVCVTLYGDGAAGQGQVFEAMNQAKLMSLPVLYVAENNIYSMGTALTRHTSDTNLYTKGDAVPGIRLDGMDILSVREGAKFCFDYIRNGNGPIVLEALTYRYSGHSTSDPGTTYRTRDEVNDIKATKDPIRMLRTKMVSSQLATEEELKAISTEATAEVAQAVEDALKGTESAREEVAYDLYCNYNGQVKMPAYGEFIVHKNTDIFKNNK